jgi:uncharacterized protein (DUF983 family)
MTTPTAATKWWSLLRMRCPRCCEGKIYAHGMTMNERCPNCNLLFDREPGYFLGALYVSYPIATVFLLIGLYLGHWLFPEVNLGLMVLIVGVCFIPFVPMVTRYARVIWIFFDRWAWPSRPGDSD